MIYDVNVINYLSETLIGHFTYVTLFYFFIYNFLYLFQVNLEKIQVKSFECISK